MKQPRVVVLDLKAIPREVPTSIECIITPELAVHILENSNQLNRPVDDNTARAYSVDMKNGDWKLNGEPVIFSKEGILLDGQHRLFACFYSKKSFQTLVTLGVDKSTFVTIDTGKKRSGSDVLHINSKLTGEPIKYASTVWSAANICLEYQRGVIKQKGGGGTRITRSETLDYIGDNSEIEAWVKLSKSQKSFMGSYSGPLAAVCYMASKPTNNAETTKYREKAEQFMHGAITGEDLKAGSPINALRQRLAVEKRLDRWERIALVIHAMNLFIEGKVRERLNPPRGQIPFIKGSEPKWATEAPTQLDKKAPKGRNGAAPKPKSIKAREASEIAYIKSGKPA